MVEAYEVRRTEGPKSQSRDPGGSAGHPWGSPRPNMSNADDTAGLRSAPSLVTIAGTDLDPTMEAVSRSARVTTIWHSWSDDDRGLL